MPALNAPDILDHLWSQTRSAYLDNPLPALFKEKLAALLSRNSSVEYCLMCHASNLRALGMSAAEVLHLLEAPAPSYERLQDCLDDLEIDREGTWPAAGSAREAAILSCCVAIYNNPHMSSCRAGLKRTLQPRLFQYLTIYLAYNRTALNWAEMNPEILAQDDQRVKRDFAPLIQDEPRLHAFFKDQPTQTSFETQRQLADFFLQAPMPMVILLGPEHRFLIANAPYEEFIGRKATGRTVAEVFSVEEAGSFIKLLDQVFKTGVPYTGKELPFTSADASGRLVRYYVDIGYYPFREDDGTIKGILAFVRDVTKSYMDRVALIEAKRQLNEALEAASMVTWKLDLASERVVFSEGSQALFGQQINQNIYDAGNSIVHPQDRDRLNRDWAEAVKECKPFYHEYRTLNADGEIRWFFSRGNIALDDEGKPIALRGIQGDISGIRQAQSQLNTERVLARRELAKANSLLRSALSAAHIETWSVDLLSQTLTWSAGMAKVFGFEGQLTLERALAFPRVHPDDLEQVRVANAQSYEPGGQGHYTAQYRVVRPDGGLSWVEVAGQSFFSESNGQKIATEFSGIMVDVTERMTAREELLRSRDAEAETRRRLQEKDLRLTLALESGRIGTWDLNPNTKHLNWSPRAAEIFGNPDRLSLSFAQFIDIIHADDRERVIAAVERALAPESDGRYEIEYRIYWPSGQVRIISASGQSRLNEFVGIILDITARKALEKDLVDAKSEAERANEIKSAFLANMSHEIRSPLGSIVGFSDLLKASDLSRTDVMQYVSVIDRNAAHLLRIIDDILDLAKVEAGKMQIEHLDFSLIELIADFSSLMVFRARDKGIEFEVRLPENLPSHINSDPTRIRQILTNVIGNAIKFTHRGGVRLEVQLEDTRPSAQLTFRVVDTGAGISAAQSEKLFQAFEQADVSTTRKFGGTGLGLVLTRRLTKALGGRFYLEQSAPREGSTFVACVAVQIPAESKMVRVNADRDLSVKRKVVASPSGRGLDGLKILVVDDSPDNQDLFKLLLTKAGAQIELAQNGQVGVDLALSDSFDVVLMDVQMPVMDGHQATRILRERGYKVPIIALTAHAMVEERERAARSGFTDFLSKPVGRDALIDMVSRFSTATLTDSTK